MVKDDYMSGSNQLYTKNRKMQKTIKPYRVRIKSTRRESYPQARNCRVTIFGSPFPQQLNKFLHQKLTKQKQFPIQKSK